MRVAPCLVAAIALAGCFWSSDDAGSDAIPTSGTDAAPSAGSDAIPTSGATGRPPLLCLSSPGFEKHSAWENSIFESTRDDASWSKAFPCAPQWAYRCVFSEALIGATACQIIECADAADCWNEVLSKPVFPERDDGCECLAAGFNWECSDEPDHGYTDHWYYGGSAGIGSSCR